MIPKNTFKILDFLLRSPGEQYNVNQIARRLKISVGSAHKILKALKSKEILVTRRFGNAIFYGLNLANEEAKKLCELILIENRNRSLGRNPIARLYAEELQKFKPVRAIVLFGSILTKGEKAGDVDVLFIIEMPADVKRVNAFCLEVSKIKARPIMPLIMTESDLASKIKEKNEVVLDIIKNGAVLSGEEVIINSIRGGG